MRSKCILAACCLAMLGCSGKISSPGASLQGEGMPFTIDKETVRHGDVYMITESGEYTLSGTLEGQVQVDAWDGTVTLYLDGVQIRSDARAPILIKNADDVTIEAVEGSQNTIIDERDEKASQHEDGAIYAVCDLRIRGEGALSVQAASGHGIKTKDDLLVSDLSLKVEAKGNALKGNDYVGIRNATARLSSLGSNGIRTSSGDNAKAGEKKGNIEVTGSQIEIHAAKDGIDAWNDVWISKDSNVRIFAGESIAEETMGSLYLVVPMDMYRKEESTFYAYFYNEADDGKWAACRYEDIVYDAGKRPYAALLCDIPIGYENVAFYAYEKNGIPGSSKETYSTKGCVLNDKMNAYLLRNGFFGDWASLQMDAEKGSTYSCMGIKAGNEVVLLDSKVFIVSKDDGIHANMEREDGNAGLGNVRLDGAKIQVKSGDDAIHADHRIEFLDGSVEIVDSHEGLEANIVAISGGQCRINAKDDGINATQGAEPAAVEITGGYVEIATATGDTDGIDSNGQVRMTGGVVIVKSGSKTGKAAGTVDATDGLLVEGGTIVAVGNISTVPSNSQVCRYANAQAKLGKGSYVLKDGDGNKIVSFALEEEYASIWIASDQMKTGYIYALEKDNVPFVQWQQSSRLVSMPGGY